eukprot:NODE_293_length_11597_cov_0.181771.p4 type:complete len:297 gc:universal NODE_293_length_11597_cov_0.181771:145-1035(+)
MKIPILSRLEFNEYWNLTTVIITMFAETILRVLFMVVPRKFLEYFQGISLKTKRSDIEHFCDGVEYHYTATKDEYILCMHRLPNPGKPAILLCHGFMMCSDIFVIGNPDNSLAKYLHALGYDVWLGNSRGNKYSKKHLRLSTDSEEYWNFSLDEIINFDIPSIIDYVLNITKQTTLTYIGFSQGTAQIFAALSVHPDLQLKINKVIALAAVIKPNPLRETIPSALIQSSPAVVYLIFGRKAMFSSVYFWANNLDSYYYTKILDIAMNILFGWTNRNIDKIDKVLEIHIAHFLQAFV